MPGSKKECDLEFWLRSVLNSPYLGSPIKGGQEAISAPPVPGKDSLPDLLTAAAAAEYIRVNKKTLYEILERKELPGTRKIGRSYRISKRKLLEYFEV